VRAFDSIEHIGVEKLLVDGVVLLVRLVVVDTSAERLGTQPAMNSPLLPPHGLESSRRHLAQETQDVRPAEAGEAHLVLRRIVRIASVERRSNVEQNQASVEVGFVECVEVYVGREVPSVADVAAHESILSVVFQLIVAADTGIAAPLDGKPLVVVGYVVDAGLGRVLLLADSDGTVVEAPEQELGDIRAHEVAFSEASEQRRAPNLAALLRTAEARVPVQVLYSVGDRGVIIVVLEVNVPEQRHPVEFRHLACLLGAVESGGGWYAASLGIRPLEVEAQPRLGIRQTSSATVGAVRCRGQRDGFEVGGVAGCHGVEKRVVRLGIHLTKLVVGKSFRIAPDAIGVTGFVSVALVDGLRLVSRKLRGIDANLLRFHCSRWHQGLLSLAFAIGAQYCNER
jgi:hypothetical protein